MGEELVMGCCCFDLSCSNPILVVAGEELLKDFGCLDSNPTGEELLMAC